jgi:putative nucleotidyltransferase with HDIG domain
LDRSRAVEELKLRLKDRNLINHSLAVEAIMRKLARYLSEDTDLWGIAGLMHDIDLERIQNDTSRHGLIGGDILEGLNFDETIIYAVRAHNPHNKYPRRRKIDKALYSSGPMSDLITACARVSPEKKLSEMDDTFIHNRFYEKGFAPEARREQILSCRELNLSLDRFIELSLEAMKEISGELEQLTPNDRQEGI